MTRALRSYPPEERKEVVKRRLLKKSGGLGYLAALDYGKPHPKKDKKVEQAPVVETES
jgi:hypothetical protein